MSLRVEGGLLFKPEDLQFDPDFPYTYCRICGEVFQRFQDRDPLQNNEDVLDNMEIRRNWSKNHARTHPDFMHTRLASSGLWAFPDAALRLATFGILALGSGVLDNEVRAALAEAPRLPNDDAEGSR